MRDHCVDERVVIQVEFQEATIAQCAASFGSTNHSRIIAVGREACITVVSGFGIHDDGTVAVEV